MKSRRDARANVSKDSSTLMQMSVTVDTKVVDDTMAGLPVPESIKEKGSRHPAGPTWPYLRCLAVLLISIPFSIATLNFIAWKFAAKDLSSDEIVEFLPTYGYKLARTDENWFVNVAAVVSKSDKDDYIKKKFLNYLVGAVSRSGDYDSSTVAKRLSVFLRDFQRGKYLDIVICRKNPEKNAKQCETADTLFATLLGPTSEDGMVRMNFTLPQSGLSASHSETPEGVYAHMDLQLRHEKIMSGIDHSKRVGRRPVFTSMDKPSHISLIPFEGVSVVSDIDDTIKVTNVGNIPKLLENTFAKEFLIVPEVLSIYRKWVADSSRGGRVFLN